MVGLAKAADWAEEIVVPPLSEVDDAFRFVPLGTETGTTACFLVCEVLVVVTGGLGGFAVEVLVLVVAAALAVGVGAPIPPLLL